MVNKPSQDGNARSTNLTHPEVGVSDKGYRASRDTAQIKVRFTDRDIALLDNNDFVFELLERARSVELSFSFDDLERVREIVSPENNRWSEGLGGLSDVAVDEKTVANDLVITVRLIR